MQSRRMSMDGMAALQETASLEVPRALPSAGPRSPSASRRTRRASVHGVVLAGPVPRRIPSDECLLAPPPAATSGPKRTASGAGEDAILPGAVRLGRSGSQRSSRRRVTSERSDDGTSSAEPMLPAIDARFGGGGGAGAGVLSRPRRGSAKHSRDGKGEELTINTLRDPLSGKMVSQKPPREVFEELIRAVEANEIAWHQHEEPSLSLRGTSDDIIFEAEIVRGRPGEV